MNRYAHDWQAARAPWARSVRMWLWIFTGYSAVDAIVFTQFPQLVQSGAYAFAFNIPRLAWALICGTATTAGVYALTSGNHRRRVAAARAVFLLYGFVGVTFGASIAKLTLEGTSSAIVGAKMWWLAPLVSVYILSRPSLYVHEAGL